MSLTATLLEYQIEHYSNRLADAVSIEERSWLREQLHNLKQPNRYEGVFASTHNVDNVMDHLCSNVGTEGRKTEEEFSASKQKWLEAYKRIRKIKCL